MTKCIDCGREFSPNAPGASLVRGPVCQKKALDNYSLPEEVNEIAQTIKQGKYSVYLVGGSVRDFLLGRKIKDYDLVTNAKSEELEKMFPKAQEVGKQFGVVKVPVKGDIVEVATFRKDGTYTDGRRPDFIEEGTLETDVARRDFTINALLLDTESNEIIDRTGGLEDIKNRQIRAIGVPQERFDEDYLRILRGFRFATVLDFDIEKNTLEAMVKNSDKLKSLPQDRILVELEKIYSSPNFSKKTQLLKESGIIANCYSSLSKEKVDGVLDSLKGKEGLNRQVIYSRFFDGNVEEMTSLYRIPYEDSKLAGRYFEVEKNLLDYDKLTLGEKNRVLSSDLFDTSLKCSDTLFKEKITEDYHKLIKDPIDKGLFTSGKELIELGFAPGKQIGEVIRELEDKVFSREIRTEAQKHNFIINKKGN